MVNRKILLLFSMVYCMIGGGCSDSPCSDKVNWDDEMKLIERYVYSGKYPQDAEWRRICDKIGTVDVKDVVALGEMFSQILESVKFNDKEYRLREFSLSVYLEFVNKLSAGLAERNHDYEKKMDFLACGKTFRDIGKTRGGGEKENRYLRSPKSPSAVASNGCQISQFVRDAKRDSLGCLKENGIRTRGCIG